MSSITSSITTLEADTGVDLDTPVVIVSCDGHASPRLKEDLRQYCPKEYLDAFDGYVEEYARTVTRVIERPNAGTQFEAQRDISKQEAASSPPEAEVMRAQALRNLKSDGIYNVQTRLKEMDRDGVAAETIFHGSAHLHPIPFVGTGPVTGVNFLDQQFDLVAVGQQIYNRWLVDFCSEAPDRLIGSGYLPFWDPEETVVQLRKAAEAGLRAVNFPAPRKGIEFYDEPVWEPFWSACEELGMTLLTHGGFLDPIETATSGRHGTFLVMFEAGGWLSRRALNRMIFGGVFERHPGLKLVLVEQNGDFWVPLAREYDSAYKTTGWIIRDQVPRRPSEYLYDHVFIGGSFLAPFEVEAAVRDGYLHNLIWGRDYPHSDGTWQYQEDDDDENMTRLALRHTFSPVAPQHAKTVLGDNPIAVYGLDGAKLQAIAESIGAPTLRELGQPLEALPEFGRGGIHAFRTDGPWG
jgi:predicted TIM-barrel fold metal-dependent hydrolase